MSWKQHHICLLPDLTPFQSKHNQRYDIYSIFTGDQLSIMSDDGFNLSEVLTEYQSNPQEVVDNYCSSSIRETDPNVLLNDLTDALAVSSESITEESAFGGSLFLIRYFIGFYYNGYLA